MNSAIRASRELYVLLELSQVVQIEDGRCVGVREQESFPLEEEIRRREGVEAQDGEGCRL